LRDPQCRESRPEGIGRVLYPAVRVKDQSRGEAAPRNGAVECSHRQRQTAPPAQPPTQDPPRVPIQDHRQIPPATATLQVRHIPTDPPTPSASSSTSTPQPTPDPEPSSSPPRRGWESHRKTDASQACAGRCVPIAPSAPPPASAEPHACARPGSRLA